MDSFTTMGHLGLGALEGAPEMGKAYTSDLQISVMASEKQRLTQIWAVLSDSDRLLLSVPREF